MKRIGLFMLLAFFALGISCVNAEKKTKDQIVSISTDFGEIKVKLYDDTPEHKANFLKLAGEGFYNDLLFHRVMKNFMIQGGDPSSKTAQPGQRLGGGGLDYTLAAEIRPKYFHKKGALAAARKPDRANPEKRSSSCQFYIVQGDILSEGRLDTMEMMINSRAKNELMKEKFTAVNEQLNQFRQNNDQVGFNAMVTDLRAQVDSIFETQEKFKFSEERRKIYSTIGGYPSLDGEYTVFGEVIEGLDVLDKIAAVKTDKNNRPVSDIKMKVKIAR